MKQREFEFIGTLTGDYGLQLEHHNIMKRFLHPMMDKKLLIKVSVFQEKRSDAQNRWYWGVAVVTIKAWRKEVQGEILTSDEIHCYNMMHVVGKKPVVKEILGMETIVMEGKTTSQMSKAEFQEFKELLQAHYAEFDCIIPDPRQNNFISDYIEK